MTKKEIQNTLKAATNADWLQVVGNGGPPCFHLDGSRFCLRAQRWDGHFSSEGNPAIHEFESLETLVAKLLLS